MTVNKKNRSLIKLAVLLFLAASASYSGAAGKKSILRVHFETARVKPGAKDIVLSAFYTIDAPGPVTFTSFRYVFNYDQTMITPTTAFFSGTAAGDAGRWNIVPSTHKFYVIADNTPNSLDTTKHILFQIWYNINGTITDSAWYNNNGTITDSAMVTPDVFEAGGLDSVVIDNTTWDPVFYWHSFGLLYPDTTKPPPPKKWDITLSSETTRIDSNTVKMVPIIASRLDSASIKTASFGFDLDTAAFDSVAVLPGALLSDTSFFEVMRSSNHITVSFTSKDTLRGPGELLQIVLRGRKRPDTLCTGLLNPNFGAFNSDALVASIAYDLKGICVFGRKDTTGTNAVVSDEMIAEAAMYPNPAHSFVDIISREGIKKRCWIYNEAGNTVLDQIFDSRFRWDTKEIASGSYTVEISNFASEGRQTKTQRGKILVIH
jgi:hypothetical protein